MTFYMNCSLLQGRKYSLHVREVQSLVHSFRIEIPIFSIFIGVLTIIEKFNRQLHFFTCAYVLAWGVSSVIFRGYLSNNMNLIFIYLIINYLFIFNNISCTLFWVNIYLLFVFSCAIFYPVLPPAFFFLQSFFSPTTPPHFSSFQMNSVHIF